MPDPVSLRARMFLVAESIEYLVKQRPGFDPARASVYLISFDEIVTHCRPLTLNEVEEIIGQPSTLRQFLPQTWKALAYHEGRAQVTIGNWPRKFQEQQR